MKLFGNRDGKKAEGVEAQAEEAVQAAVAEKIAAAEKAEAIEKSGLVLSIEGLNEDAAPAEVTPLSLNTEPYQKKTADSEDDDFLKELHALLDEKGKSASLDAAEEEIGDAMEEVSAPLFEEEPVSEPEPAIEPEPASDPELSFEPEPAAEPEPASKQESAGSEDAEPVSDQPVEEIDDAEQAPASEAESAEAAIPAEEKNDASAEKAFVVSEPQPEKKDLQDTKSFASVSYESMAKAMEQSGQSKAASPTRRTRSAIDDETLLAELYTLMGDTPKAKRTAPSDDAGIPASQAAVHTPETAQSPVHIQDPMQNPITPAPQGIPEQQFRPNPIGFDKRQTYRSEPEPIPVRDAGGAPGWLKGVFLLILSAALSGMTLYAVMMDIFGKVF